VNEAGFFIGVFGIKRDALDQCFGETAYSHDCDVYFCHKFFIIKAFPKRSGGNTLFSPLKIKKKNQFVHLGKPRR
jgi:hypothetical protein